MRTSRFNLISLAAASAVLLSACVTGPQAQQSKQFTTFKDCPNCPEMVVLPAASFLMGSPPDEPLRDPDETQHTVTFAHSFAVSRFSITWDQWEACVRDAMCDGLGVETALRLGRDGTPAKDYVDHGRGTRPVVGVTWYDAQVFVGWLNRKSKTESYRLLSEAEYEYAARGGTKTAYPWGAEPSHEYANTGNFGDQIGGEAGGRDVWVNETAPVGSFPPNPFGLYDMQGNIFHWVEDCYEADSKKLPSDGSAVKSGNCNVRSMRGSTFMSNPHLLRSANRAGQYPPNLRGRNYLGIRVAKTLE